MSDTNVFPKNFSTLYINDIILPRLIELSKLNKTIIVSTHDANIGVRTLPLLSVYREYLGDGRFSKNFDAEGSRTRVEWSCPKTLLNN